MGYDLVQIYFRRQQSHQARRRLWPMQPVRRRR